MSELPIVVGDALDAGVVEPADAVIGNPPWGQKRFELSQERRRELRASYQCARGAIEPASLFVELAHRVLEPGGRWGFVLPDIILLKNQRPVRELILNRSQIECLAHAGRAFDGVNLDAAVCVGSILARDQKVEPHPVWQQLSPSFRADTPPSLVRHQSRYQQLDESRFNLFASESDLDAMLWLRRGRLFGDLFEIHEGVHTGNCRDKLFVTGDGPTRRPVIVGGKELSPFCLRWAGRYLECDPDALDRDAGDYANLGQPGWFGPGKLVVRRTGDRVVCAVDERGFAVSNNLFVVLPREPMTTDELWACAGLLGSRLYTWFFRTAVPRKGRLFAELKIGPLSRFPFPPATAWTAAAIAQLAALARSLAAAHDESTAAALDAAVRELFEKPAKTWSVTARRSRVVQ